MPAHKYFTDDWIEAIGEDALLEQLYAIDNALVELRESDIILPEAGNPLLFQAFRETPFSKVKVVVMGMDPYHDSSFNGLAFGNGSRDEFKKDHISPSLRNILTEVKRTENLDANPNLYSWAQQGVLLINTAHSVVEGVAGSHLELWRPFTDLVLSALHTKENLVWMLWGSKAQAFKNQISDKHKILTAGHPSPLNNKYPFVGCNCFQDCNNYLKNINYEPIIWM